jgi:hypothetical protein
MMDHHRLDELVDEGTNFGLGEVKGLVNDRPTATSTAAAAATTAPAPAPTATTTSSIRITVTSTKRKEELIRHQLSTIEP